MITRCVTHALVAGALTLGSAACGGSADPGSTTPSASPTHGADGVATARALCRAAVLDELRAPGTARFVADAEDVVTGAGGAAGVELAARYDVTGEVDAENGFGALLRVDYACAVYRDPRGAWSVVSLDVGGEPVR